jgi:hypothetical protein
MDPAFMRAIASFRMVAVSYAGKALLGRGNLFACTSRNLSYIATTGAGVPTSTLDICRLSPA